MAEKPGALLGVDVGTTHCKAGLFAVDGRLMKLSSRPTLARRAADGHAYFDPQELWETAAAAISEAASAAGPYTVAAIGIASMAETGLLVDRKTGQPRSALLPWFDSAAAPQAVRIAGEDDPLRRFSRSGIRPSFKCSLAKLLWLQEREPGIADQAVWLSTADYIAYRLTAQFGTDYSLAGRTLAFRLDQNDWDGDWLRHFGLDPEVFPPAAPGGRPVGGLALEIPGLAVGIPVAVSGHDHVCAAFAAGAVLPGQVFDSVGTAESFIGLMEEGSRLGEKEFASGLSYGRHAVPGRLYWMGGLSASGGSVEWLRSVLGEPPLSYTEIEALLDRAPEGPTGILYFPYLAGSGSPHTQGSVRGAFAGLAASHGRAELLKAVLEGTAYEMEFIRRAAEQATGLAIGRFKVAGGGVRNRAWMQIKADVSGCRLDLLSIADITLLGAALLAGIGSGFYGKAGGEDITGEGASNALYSTIHARLTGLEVETVTPDSSRHQAYQELYEHGFLKLQEPLRAYGRWMAGRV